ncbi:MAG: peptidoglycan-binding protein, partial [Clostridia bacterium]|nr:peptidoglycan-binding protein [Clostridia bacterium]
PTATARRTPTPLPPNTYMRVTAAPGDDYATLRRGYTGTPVTNLQRELKSQGYYTGTVDGVYGEGTENAVKAFQRTNGLNVDGVAGPATLRVLYEGNFPRGS